MRSMLRENGVLKPTARILWEIQEFASKPPVETATNLYTDIRRQAEAALLKGEERRRAVRDAEGLARYRREIREAFLDCIGGPIPEDAAPARVVGRQVCDGFILERVLLAPRKGSLATANVYVPAGPDGRKPAVLVAVGHTDQGKADPEYQYLAQLLAHAGFVTLVLDPLGEGERFEHYERDIDFQPIQGCSGEHDLLDWKCKLLGQSLARYFIQDGLAALDYLVSREDVDKSRVALTGHSGGGTQTIMLMAAAGDRFACAAPCAYVTDNRAMLDCTVDPDNEMLWPGSMAKGLDYVDLLAGMAPKPVLFLTNQHDFFPREGTLRTFEEARQLWLAAGSATPPEMVTAPSQHAYPQALARAAARFFGRCLMGREPSLTDFAFDLLPDQALWCTPQGILPKAYPTMKSVHDALLDELTACRQRRGGLSAEAVTAWLRDALHEERIAREPDARVYAEGVCGHYAYRCIAWRPQEGYWNTGALLRDMRLGDGPMPTVIALWPEGLSRMEEHAHWIHRAVRQGWQVLVMDMTASGSLLPASLGSTMYIGWGTMYKLNAYLMQLGDSLFALRVRQAIAATRMLARWPEADMARLCYYATGECSRLASLASLITGLPGHTDEAYQSYEEIVSERYHDQTHTYEWVFPGALNCFDAADVKSFRQIRGLLAPNPADHPPVGNAPEQ